MRTIMHQPRVALHLDRAAANPAATLPRIPEWRSFWGAIGARVNKNQHLLDAWQRDLKLKIAWALAAKLLGLALLWFLFFRGHGA
jgi:hypothetical protein